MPPNRKISDIKQGFPLNPAQRAAAEAPPTPLLIVAGAGTGKTRTLTSRIAYLIKQGVPPTRICAITFTNKAAKEMLGRLTGHHGPFIGTFHALGARILRRECRAFGRGPNFVIFDDHDSFDLVKKIIKGESHLTKKDTPSFFMGKIAEMKNLDETRPDATGSAKEAPERRALAAAIFQKYEEALARNNAFDFDDLIEKPVALFKKYSDILKKYQGLFDVILVDEYQDINPKQYELVKLLAGAHRNLSVVGDDEQTIYSWRYADIRTFLGFEKEWPGAKVYFLEENYRSTANIIRAAAAVAAENRYRTPKNLWTANPEGERITLFEAWGENDEAEWIAKEIQNVTAQNENGAGPATARSDIAILYRTNAQSRAVEQALIRRNIPYQIFGGLKFYERREVKDAVAALRWASNGRDEVARERLEKNLSKKKFAMFARRVAEAGAMAHTPTKILKLFLDVFGYFDYLEANFLNAEEREENIAELLGFAAESDDLPDFLEKISLLQATDDPVAGAADTTNAAERADAKEKVNLMTIHLAKGLEFPHVFIAGASEGLLPHIRSIDNEESLEEERRLMYVAMTRAKEKLRVSFYGMPSRFITEIPEECMELAAATDAATDAAGDTIREPGGEDRVIHW
jgi:ATP-dependent DNA helicase UvrD/PcrA